MGYVKDINLKVHAQEEGQYYHPSCQKTKKSVVPLLCFDSEFTASDTCSGLLTSFCSTNQNWRLGKFLVIDDVKTSDVYSAILVLNVNKLLRILCLLRLTA